MSAAVCSTTNPKMDLVVRTLYKTLVLDGVDASSEVADVKNLLHQRGLQEHIPIPVPSKQRLVFKGNVLTSGNLQNAGIRSGDHVVLLLHRPHTSSFARPVDTTPVPNAAAIRSAIIAEARRRGIENTITEEPTRAFRHYGGMPMEVDQQLMQLIHALRGRTVDMEARVGQARQANGAAGEGGAAAAGGQQQAGAGGGRRYRQPPMHGHGVPQAGLMPPGMMLFGMPPAPPAAAAPAAAGPAPLPPPAAIPQPDAEAVAQLGEMGFGEAVVRKALLLHRNEMEAALNWLLQHGDDPAAAEPLTEEQLRQIYSRGPRGPPSEPELVEQLVAMGFERNQSAAALRRFRNMDMALAYLLRAAEEGGEQQQQAGAEGGAGPAGAAAPAPGGQQQARVPEAMAQHRPEGDGGQQQGAQPAAAGFGRGGDEARQVGRGVFHGAGGSEGGHSVDLPDLASTDGEDEDEDMMQGLRSDRQQRRADEAGGGGERGPAGAMVQQQGGADAAGQGQGQAQGMLIDGGADEEHGIEGEVGDDMEEDEDDDEGEEDEEEDDDFAAVGRGAELHMPLGGGGLRLAAAGTMPDDAMGPMGAFEAPFALYGGAPHGIGGTAPAMAVTRGPDGNDLVLGSSGATMPPLMPARGMMLGGMGMGAGGGAGVGGGGLGPQLMDLPGLLQGGGPGDDELEMQGMGLVQQLLNAVLRDAMGGGGGEGGGGGVPGNRR